MCKGTGCVSAGSSEIFNTFKEKVKGLQDVQVQISGCHGFCQQGPIVVIEPEGIFYTKMKKEDVDDVIESHIKNRTPVKKLFYCNPVTGESIVHYRDIPFYAGQHRIILRNCGHINPEKIEDYIDVGGYKALKKVVHKLNPQKIIEELKKSGLRGRGGGGFPTGRKWESCLRAIGEEKYVVCNADEGDPGAFMDRSLLEGDPHALLEGMIIAGYTLDAKKGYIYVRAEYPLAVNRLKIAIEQAKEKGFLEKNIFGTGFDFEIEIFQGAGAFVCGESTALVKSIEGKRGMPKAAPRSHHW